MLRTTISMLFLTLSAAAASANVITVEAPLPEGAKATDVRFEADEARGSAWVSVRYVIDEPVGEGPRVDETTIAVPGLSYDADTRSVRIDGPGGPTVCATKKKALFTTVYRAAPGCSLKLAEPLTTARVVLEVEGSAKLAARTR
jgi:hypothetical protein